MFLLHHFLTGQFRASRQSSCDGHRLDVKKCEGDDLVRELDKSQSLIVNEEHVLVQVMQLYAIRDDVSRIDCLSLVIGRNGKENLAPVQKTTKSIPLVGVLSTRIMSVSVVSSDVFVEAKPANSEIRRRLLGNMERTTFSRGVTDPVGPSSIDLTNWYTLLATRAISLRISQAELPSPTMSMFWGTLCSDECVLATLKPILLALERREQSVNRSSLRRPRSHRIAERGMSKRFSRSERKAWALRAVGKALLENSSLNGGELPFQ